MVPLLKTMLLWGVPSEKDTWEILQKQWNQVPLTFNYSKTDYLVCGFFKPFDFSASGYLIAH